MTLGTVNGKAVISAERVPWQADDDSAVIARCSSRGLVRFEGGGSSDAVVIESWALLWEREGRRFRAFPVAAGCSLSGELVEVASALRRLAFRCDTDDRETSAMLVNIVGMLNATAKLRTLRGLG